MIRGCEMIKVGRRPRGVDLYMSRVGGMVINESDTLRGVD